MKPGCWVGWTILGRPYTARVEAVDALRRRVKVRPDSCAFGMWIGMEGLRVIPEAVVWQRYA